MKSQNALFQSYNSCLCGIAVWVAKVSTICGQSPSPVTYAWAASNGLRINIVAVNPQTAQELKNRTLDSYKLCFSDSLEKDTELFQWLIRSISAILRDGLPNSKPLNVMAICELSEKERHPIGVSDDPRPRMEKACERLSEPPEPERARAFWCLPPAPFFGFLCRSNG